MVTSLKLYRKKEASHIKWNNAFNVLFGNTDEDCIKTYIPLTFELYQVITNANKSILCYAKITLKWTNPVH